MFTIPKLAEDGENWVTYKERMLTTIGARGLMRYIDGRRVIPAAFAIDAKSKLPVKADGSATTEAEIEELEDKIDEYYQRDAYVKQYIFSTIMDRLLLHVQKLGSSANIWAEICTIHEGKTELVVSLGGAYRWCVEACVTTMA